MTTAALGREFPTGWRAMSYGALGGVMMVVLEFLVLSQRLVSPSWFELGVHLLLQWVPAGIAIAYFVLHRNGRVPGVSGAVLLVGFAAALSAIIVEMRGLTRSLAAAIVPGPLTVSPAPPSFLYTFWITLFYGGLFMAACAQSARAEQTRRALGQAEIERQRHETLLGEAALRALKARVDPDVLLRAVAEIARRYEANPGAADRLLDALVVFLRCATSDVRDGCETERGGLRLAAAYGLLLAQLDPDGPCGRAAPGLECEIRIGAAPDAAQPTPGAPSPRGSRASGARDN